MYILKKLADRWHALNKKMYKRWGFDLRSVVAIIILLLLGVGYYVLLYACEVPIFEGT